MSSIKSVFPNAQITPNCINSYPIRVKIEAHENGNTQTIWQGDQRNLFRKYASQRQKAIEEMVKNLNDLKASKL
ncbi:hypothetical protein ACHAWT_010118 [Skeletonema menzelii]